MAAANDLAIANMGLALLGDKKITAIDDTTEIGRRVNAVYDRLQEDLLRCHPWPFALKRAILSRVTGTKVVITGITKVAAAVVTTSGAHGFSTGNEVCITTVVGMTEINGLSGTITVLTSTTFSIDINSTNFTAYASAGVVGVCSAAPSFGWDFRFEKPSDYLRCLEINGNDLVNGPDLDLKYSVEGDEIYAADETLAILYIFLQTDVTKYDATFTKLLARYIAAELAFSITQSRTLADDQRKAFAIEMRAAMSLSAQERGIPRSVRQDAWIDGRG